MSIFSLVARWRGQPSPLSGKSTAPGEIVPSSTPAGTRIYAVGDVHGRLDLLKDLVDRLESHNQALPPARTFLVFLGDLIDRGPDSRGVIDFLLRNPADWAKCVFLKGNHEQAFASILNGDMGKLQDWLRVGGAACAKSYGVAPERLAHTSGALLLQELHANVPASHKAFLSRMFDTFSLGDYLFVHAGVRPGVLLDDQHVDDLLWIRDEFLSSSADHGKVVVHGHSIVESAQDFGNRIALDTGAYRTGRLSCFYAENATKSFIRVERFAEEFASA